MEQVLKHDDGGWNSTPWRIAAWSTAAALMLLPISIQLISGNFGWTIGDFIFAAVVLLVSCSLFDWVARKSPNFSYLAGGGAALAAGFGLIVVNGAVGLVGSEDENHNLLFLAVILVAIVGAILARGRPASMARAMTAAAVTHFVISTVLLVRAGGVSDGDPTAEVVGLSIFAGVWLASAALFRNSAR